MNLRDREVLVCLIVISCIVHATSNNVQEFSDFQFLSNVIEQKAVVQLDTNSKTESAKNLTISDQQEDKENIEPNIFGKKDSEELGMDTVTLIWYLTTFTALFGFFIVMACTENSCNQRRNQKPVETRNPTPSPCPSYKHFAPPTYASVMNKINDPKVFIVPVHEGSNDFFTNPADVQVHNQNNSELNIKNETTMTLSR
ncbi:hypothetical protein ACKWTF_012423 [Chironomus riparius]